MFGTRTGGQMDYTSSSTLSNHYIEKTVLISSLQRLDYFWQKTIKKVSFEAVSYHTSNQLPNNEMTLIGT
jgi:hypothetical protein